MRSSSVIHSLRRGVPLVLLASAGAATVALAAPAEQRKPVPKLTSADARVAPGELLTVRGRNFPQDVHVTLLAGKARRKAEPIGAARTGRRGGFVAQIEIEHGAAPGRYLAVACHDRCRNEARLEFRVLRP